MFYKKMTVADLLANSIHKGSKTRQEVAIEAGFDDPEAVDLIIRELSKLPIQNVPKLAETIGIDPKYLLRVVMTEYMPEIWAVFEQVSGELMLTKNERDLVRQFRSVTRNNDMPFWVTETATGTGNIYSALND